MKFRFRAPTRSIRSLAVIYRGQAHDIRFFGQKCMFPRDRLGKCRPCEEIVPRIQKDRDEGPKTRFLTT